MNKENSKRKRFFLFCKPDLTLAVLGVVTGAAEIVVSNYFHLNRAYFGYTILFACLCKKPSRCKPVSGTMLCLGCFLPCRWCCY